MIDILWLLLVLINQYRLENGLSALKVSPELSCSAMWKSEDMAVNSYFSHNDLNRIWRDRIRYFGYTKPEVLGENLAGGQQTAQEALEAWKLSPKHNQVLLDPKWKYIGLGYYYLPGSTYGYYWVADFAGMVIVTIPTVTKN